jgi:hypothetical protein
MVFNCLENLTSFKLNEQDIPEINIFAYMFSSV